MRKTVSIQPTKNISEIVELLRIQSQFPESNLTKEFSQISEFNFYMQKNKTLKIIYWENIKIIEKSHNFRFNYLRASLSVFL